MKLENPKLEIAKIIKSVEIDGLTISKYHIKPQVFTTLPAITYKVVGEDSTRYFNKMINDRFSFGIDVWADKVSDLSKIVLKVKEAMLEAGYYQEDGRDLDDPSKIKRYTMIFERR